MKVSPALSKILSESLLVAKQNNHQFYTPEHILATAIKDESVESLLKNSGADIQIIKAGIVDYLTTKIPVCPTIKDSDLVKGPIESAGFQAIMNRAVFNCVTAFQDILDITDVIVGMFEETNNYCSYYLRRSGIDKVLLLENISNLRQTKNQKENPKDEQPFPPMPDGLVSNNKGGLKRFAVNMTEQAKNGVYDQLIGREEELERTIQVLCRRTKNNPLHVGEAGVGKTAITQGLAQRIVKNQVPDTLKGCTIYSLDLGLILAGAKFRGDFEERLRSIIDEVKEVKKVILFIDEIHMIMGAGTNGNSQMDAANLLKPVLSSGEVKFIGSTTYEEYSKYFEKDRALARRFQKIDINEPTPDETVKIIKGLIEKYENHHQVKYTTSAIEEAVKLSVKYLTDRHLPDKAIDIIDEAGAYQHILSTGGFLGTKSGAKSKINTVNTQTIKNITAKISKLPVESIANTEKQRLKEIDQTMQQSIFGQQNAITILSKAVKRARAGFRNPDKPEANYLFVGPTGCGKTELAKVLAKILNEPLLRYDMSEYQEKHTVSRLVGSPPGYVGFEEGGQLTKDIRKNPHSVVLFDEIEKAHEDIYNILLQIMDYGVLTDTQGKKADFRNCIIIMTSNAGARDMEKPEIGFGSTSKDNSSLLEAVNRQFPPEFRNRLDAVIPFNHLDLEIAKKVCQKEINNLANRMKANKVNLSVTEPAVNYLTQAGYSKEFGARNIARTIEEKIANELVDEVLFGKLEKGGNVTVDCSEETLTFSY